MNFSTAIATPMPVTPLQQPKVS